MLRHECGAPGGTRARSWRGGDDAPFGFLPLPPGRWRLTIREGDREWERDVEIAAGKLTEVELTR